MTDFEEKWIQRNVRYDRNSDVQMRFQSKIRNQSIEATYNQAVFDWLKIVASDEKTKEFFENSLQFSAKINEFYAISEQKHQFFDENSSISFKISHFLIDFWCFLNGIRNGNISEVQNITVNKGKEVLNFIILHYPDLILENKPLMKLISKNKLYKCSDSEQSKKCYVAKGRNYISNSKECDYEIIKEVD